MRVKRILSIILTMAMVISSFPAPAVPVQADGEPSGFWTDFAKKPTVTDSVYEIHDASELAWVAEQVNREKTTFEGCTIKLDDSVDVIDLSGHFWVPIGYSCNYNVDLYFNGTFDGNNKIISNLTIGAPESPDTEQCLAGLFGYVIGTDISNVCLEDVAIYSSCKESCAGGLSGCAMNCRITNCYATGSIISGGENTCLGGLLGVAGGDE